MSTHTLSAKSSNDSLHSTSSTESFPDKLAPAVASPMVWQGSELDSAKYIVQLSPQDVHHVRAAVIKVKST
jgi:hypothetical protein